MLKRILAAFAAAILLCVSSLALAGSVTLTWTNPTKRTDGSALTNLASVSIYRATSAAGPFAKIASVAAPATTYTDASAPGGSTVYYVATAVDANGLESAQTAQVSAAVPVAPPLPPTGLTVTNVTAFEMYYRAGHWLLARAVGTVPLGTACYDGAHVGAYYRVPFESVSFTRRPRSVYIGAQCARA